MQLEPGAPLDVGICPERIERVRARCAEWVDSGHTPTIVACVARHGRIVLHEAFGRLRPETDAPATRLDSIFPISSVTTSTRAGPS